MEKERAREKLEFWDLVSSLQLAYLARDSNRYKRFSNLVLVSS